MHIKFLSHGTGDPQRAKAYLLQKFDHNGVPRPEVRVLRGNPQAVADVAQSLKFVHIYTSAVIAWHPVDKPTEQDVEAVLDDFERAAFSGMEPDQYACTAISHGGHVHIFAARVELRTGKSHNMAPPSGKKIFEHLRNHWNFKRGWARPDDPNRARTVQPLPNPKSNLSKIQAVEADELLSAFSVEPDLGSRVGRHAAVVEWIQQQVLDKTIKSRADVLAALAKIGTLNRQSDDYVSVRFEDFPKPIRFRGTLFAAAFDPTLVLKSILGPAPTLNSRRDDPDPERAAVEGAAFEQAVAARSRYNARRYLESFPEPYPRDTFTESPDPSETEPLHRSPKESLNDRTRSLAVEEFFRLLELSKSAIRGLTSACQLAVESVRRVERASVALERASRAYERASQRFIEARKYLRAGARPQGPEGEVFKKPGSPRG